MESALWAINLCAVVYLCFWAIKEDNKEITSKRAAKERQDEKVER
jgi:hypothetical protein